MQDLLSGQIRLSEVFVNRCVDETEFKGMLSIILVGEDTVIIKFTESIYSISAVSLRLENIRHDSVETSVQFRVGNVVSKNLLAKPLVVIMKNRFLSWLVQIIGSVNLPTGIIVSVKGEEIKLEMQQWFLNTSIGKMDMPIIGNVFKKTKVTLVKFHKGEIVIDTAIVDN